MRVIGLDQATEVFGFGVIDVVQGRPVYVACGVFHAPASWPRFRRLQEIHKDLLVTLEEYVTADTDAVLEGVHHKFAAAALGGGEARGLSLAALFAAGVDWNRVHSIPPAQMKRGITGDGHATKGAVGLAVKVSLGMRHAPELDASDALGLALAWSRGVRGTSPKKRAVKLRRATVPSGES